MAWKWWYQSPINKELRNKILEQVKTSWLPVKQIAEEYNINPNTIYTWLKRDTEETSWIKHSFWEINRLKKDKQDLLLIIWELTAELNKTKKKKYHGN